MTTERYQCALDRMMEPVSTKQTNTFDHVKLVESYKSLSGIMPLPCLAFVP